MLIANCCEISMLNSFIMLEYRDIDNYHGAILYWVFIVLLHLHRLSDNIFFVYFHLGTIFHHEEIYR